MEVVWVIIAVVVVAGIIVLSVLNAKRWIAVRTEGASRAHQIEQLQAYLKTQGVKSKVGAGAAGTVQLKVLKSDEAKARTLFETFENEQ